MCLLLCASLCVQDVPAALNGLLDSLPAKISIQGLPFDAVFTYALYTLNYVIVKVGSSGKAALVQPQPQRGVVWQQRLHASGALRDGLGAL